MNAHKFDAIHTNTYMFPARQTDRHTEPVIFYTGNKQLNINKGIIISFRFVLIGL